MSIPRLAIHRPVTMFMISLVVMLLGAISLTRLPVDLMPETEFPSITVRVNYAGVGPLEMEELVTRPIEQAVSAIAGLEEVNSSSNEGSRSTDPAGVRAATTSAAVSVLAIESLMASAA